MNLDRNFKIIIAAIIFAILVVAGYFAYKNYYSATPENKNGSPAIKNTQLGLANKPEVSAKKPASKMETSLAGFKLYKNSEFGFEIQYPDSWTVSEEDIVNVRGENTKAFYFKKSDSNLRFVILPRDGLSYGLPAGGTTTPAMIGDSPGSQTQYTLPDGRRLWLLHPQYGLYNWSQDIGRIDILSSAVDPAGDSAIFEKMLNSFKLSR